MCLQPLCLAEKNEFPVIFNQVIEAKQITEEEGKCMLNLHHDLNDTLKDAQNGTSNGATRAGEVVAEDAAMLLQGEEKVEEILCASGLRGALGGIVDLSRSQGLSRGRKDEDVNSASKKQRLPPTKLTDATRAKLLMRVLTKDKNCTPGLPRFVSILQLNSFSANVEYQHVEGDEEEDHDDGAFSYNRTGPSDGRTGSSRITERNSNAAENSNAEQCGLFLLPAYINHSCKPNITRCFSRRIPWELKEAGRLRRKSQQSSAKKIDSAKQNSATKNSATKKSAKIISANKTFMNPWMIIRSSRDLLPNQEICDTYVSPTQPYAVRMKDLFSHYGFLPNNPRTMLERKVLEKDRMDEFWSEIMDLTRNPMRLMNRSKCLEDMTKIRRRLEDYVWERVCLKMRGGEGEEIREWGEAYWVRGSCYCFYCFVEEDTG
jgi:hypothetical protein